MCARGVLNVGVARGLIGRVVFAVGGRAVFSMACLDLIGCRLFWAGLFGDGN